MAAQRDHAAAIRLGCADMADLEEAITGGFGVPVVDGTGVAPGLAEGIVGMELATSKVSPYAPPERKKIAGWPVSVPVGLQSAAGIGLNAGDPS
jgi:allantoin racemase